MSKLEQLAAYLPYKLMCLVDGKYKVKLNSVYSDGSCTFCDLIESEKGFKTIKPILKPIDDADSFIRTQFTLYTRDKQCDNEAVDLFCYEKLRTDDLLSVLNLKMLPYDSIQWLLKNHYDVFDMLKSGDAILEYEI